MEEYLQKQKEQHRSLTSLKDFKIPEIEDIIIEFASAKETNERIQSRGSLVFDQEDESDEMRYVPVDRCKTMKDYEMLERSLSKHFVFGQLTNNKEVTAVLLDCFVCCEVNKGVYLIQQGEDGNTFFVLHSGLLEVEFNGKVKRQIKPQQGFGELALLHNCPRSASVRAVQTSILWVMTRSVFKTIIQETFQNQFIKARKFVQKLKQFEELTDRQKDSLANVLYYRCCQNSEVLGEEGQPIQSYFFLEKGEVKVYEQGSLSQQMPSEYSCICNQIIKNSSHRTSIIEAGQNCCIYELNKNKLSKTLGKQFHQLLLRNKIFPHLLNSPYFSKLPKDCLQRIFDTFQIQFIKAGQTIVDLGHLKRNLIFLILNDFNVFYGQQSILEQNQQEIYKQKIVLKQDGYIISTNFKKIQSTIEGKYEKICNDQLKLQEIGKREMVLCEQFRNHARKLRPSNMYHVKKISQNNIHLVVDSEKKYLYALKCVERKEIEEKRLQKAVKEEKSTLELSQSPFLMRYGRSFKDEKFIYFLTEFIDGMDFFDAMGVMGIVTPKDSRFYLANLVYALEHLHTKDIIYRGLKPENIILSSDGYLKLTNMRNCKIMKNKSITPKTFTIIGTPHYMAPEIVQAKGYNYSVDLWSLGIILYELVCGVVPFGAYDEDPFDVYESILKRELKYPSSLKDSKCKHMIEQLLSKIPERRLRGSYSALKSHQFFDGIQWDKIYEKKIEAPYYVPEDRLLCGSLQKFNFKKMKTVEEYFMKKDVRCERITARMSAIATSLINWDESFD